MLHAQTFQCTCLVGFDRMWFGFHPWSSLFLLPCCKLDATSLAPQVAQGLSGENNTIGLSVLSIVIYSRLSMDSSPSIYGWSWSWCSYCHPQEAEEVWASHPLVKMANWAEEKWGWKERMDNIHANKSSAAINIAVRNVYYQHKWKYRQEQQPSAALCL